MVAHGFTVKQLVELVHAELAMAPPSAWSRRAARAQVKTPGAEGRAARQTSSKMWK
jgi:hypothetical protein